MRGSAALDVHVRAELRERQKRELRRERDRLVLDLAASLGADGLARSLGTTPATAETLVLRAQARVSARPRRISAARLSADRERWAEADRHFEALGRSARLPPAPPRGS